MADVAMPRLSDSMEGGTIRKWLKSDGDDVKRGEELVEIETDDANMTFESNSDGVLQIVAHEGDTLEIGETMARLGTGARPAAGEDAGEGDADGRAKASPAPEKAPEPDVPPAPLPRSAKDSKTAKGEVTHQDLTKVQQVVARRMAESKATAPDFVLDAEVDMSAATEIRNRLKERAISSDGPAPSFNDMVVKACALALRDFPRANGAFRDGRFELYSRVNVGIAVAGQDALVVPTIYDADRKSLEDIARDSRALAERVRAGAVTPPELSGGTFTVSNLGMYGIRSFTAVINPPQAAVLAVGQVAERAVVRDGEVVARPTMDVRLACDHRILYGAEAAQFLARIRDLLQEPLGMAP